MIEKVKASPAGGCRDMYHGRACRKRSFPFTCKQCGARVLFWECTHGCKVVFEFDTGGRLAGRHRCKATHGSTAPKKPRKWFDLDNSFDMASVSKRFLENLFKESYRCPACKATFKTETSYFQHVKQKAEMDEVHARFYESNEDVISVIAGDGQPEAARPARPSAPPPEIASNLPAAGNAINEFGRIKLKGKGKDGESRPVKTPGDWWDEFTG